MRKKLQGKFKPIETYLILHTLLFGLILLCPTNTFDNPVYHTMSILAQEEVWGSIYVLIAILQFVAMCRNNQKMKIIILSLTASLWSSVGTSFLIESIGYGRLNTGVSYLAIAGLAVWLSYVIGGERNETK
jgi:hypothetical protein